MKYTNLFRIVFPAALALTVSLSPSAFGSEGISKICVFGDSLSDTGNQFTVEHQISVRPFELIPDAPYILGGINYSNGRLWIQRLAKSLGKRSDSWPAFATDGKTCNYSFGRARARAREQGEFDLPALVSRHLDEQDPGEGADTLFVFFIGANDVRDALTALSTGGSEVILGDAIFAIVNNILRLNAVAGAERFLILNAPDISLTPAVKLLGPDAQYWANYLTVQFNSGLQGQLSQLVMPGLRIDVFDSYGFFNKMVDVPPRGVTDVENACIVPGVYRGAICRNPDAHAFWDGIHPTRVVHRALARAVKNSL